MRNSTNLDRPPVAASDPVREEMAAFVHRIANLFKDGEEDNNGEWFVMSYNDAMDTVESLINRARDLRAKLRVTP